MLLPELTALSLFLIPGSPPSPAAAPTVPQVTASTDRPDAKETADDEDDDDDEAVGIAGESEELRSAREVEKKALDEEEELRRGRAAGQAALGPGNPLLSRMRDLPGIDDDLNPEERDSAGAGQIARELEQFQTFDLGAVSSRYDIPVELNEQVSQYIRLFQGALRPHFVLWLGRSSRYIPRMREILAKEEVPSDTVFLSLIESGFNTLAYSRAAAAGQWQFIASTGRRFGLRSDFWVDERRDPEKATLAAAHYLKELRSQLGSWYLAWAGYNAGAGTILKAIRRNQSHSTDFWELAHGRVLKRETKGYVPKLIAAALISKHPHAFGFDDVTYQQPESSETIPVPEPTELSFLAKAAGTEVQTLRDLNPALRRFCTPPPLGGVPYVVHLPVGTSSRVLAALEARPASQRLSFRYHRVAPGEGLAAVAREFKVDPQIIARMNGLHRALRPGRELVIPVVGGAASDSRIASVADEREVYRNRGRWRRGRRVNLGWRASDDCQDPFAQGSAAEPLVLEAELPSTPAKVRSKSRELLQESPPADAVRYRVTEGDSLWSIAQAHNLTLEQLCRWNGITHSVHLRLYPGQKLWISEKGGESVAADRGSPQLKSSPLASASGNAPGTYTLRSGDNLWQIAKRHHLKVEDLLRWNRLDPDAVLKPGTSLQLAASATP